MGNLYDFPAKALNEIRRIMSRDMDIYLEAPSKVGLFVYDNKTLVVENFNDEPVEVRIVTDDEVTRLEIWRMEIFWLPFLPNPYRAGVR